MPLFQRGDFVGEGDRYKIVRKVGEGQFSEVYEVVDSVDSRTYALKIERSPDVRTIRAEYKVLRRLQQCPQICKGRGSGTHSGRFYILLDLLGQNLVEMRRSAYGGRMDLTTAKLVALNLLVPLEAMHREGLIHRDVKPANFAIYPPGASGTEGKWTLIDFGLAKRYRDEEGRLLPERSDASFRGSSTYASAQVMEHKDQGRRDDLWSWLYLLVELVAGTLPWRLEGEGAEKLSREAILRLKLSCMANPQQLLGSMHCPQAVVELSRYLEGLRFEDSPDYDRIRAELERLDELSSREAAYGQAGPAANGAAGMDIDAGLWDGGTVGMDIDTGPRVGSAAGGSAPQQPPPRPKDQPPMALDLEGLLQLPRWTSAQFAGPPELPTDQPQEQQPGQNSGLHAGYAHAAAPLLRPAAAAAEGDGAPPLPLIPPGAAAELSPAAEGSAVATPPSDDHRMPEAAALAGGAHAAGPPGAASQPPEQQQHQAIVRDRAGGAAGEAREGSSRQAQQEWQRERDRERGDGARKPPRRPGSTAGGAAASMDRSSGGGASSAVAAAGPTGSADISSRRQAAAAAASDGRRAGKDSGAAAVAASGQGERAKRIERGGSSKGGGGGERHGRSRSGERRPPSRDRRGRSRSRSGERRGRSYSGERRGRSRSGDRRGRSRSGERRWRSRSGERRGHSRSGDRRGRSRSGERRGRSRTRSSSSSRSRSRSRSWRDKYARDKYGRDKYSRDKRRDRSRSRSRLLHRSSRSPHERPPSRSGRPTAQEPPVKQQQQQPQQAEPHPAVQQQQQLNDADVRRYREALDYVFALKQGGISAGAEKACRVLRALPPVEALGAICWILDEVGSLEGGHSQQAGEMLQDVAAFAACTARRCRERQDGGDK